MKIMDGTVEVCNIVPRGSWQLSMEHGDDT